MAEINKTLRDDLLYQIRTVLPDAEYAPDEMYWPSNEFGINFSATCGCYSEWTQEPCSLDVFIRATFAKDDERDKRELLELKAASWAKACLTWSGCECCGEDYLGIWVRLFHAKGKKVDGENSGS